MKLSCTHMYDNTQNSEHPKGCRKIRRAEKLQRCIFSCLYSDIYTYVCVFVNNTYIEQSKPCPHTDITVECEGGE